jgi:hypothetical protein
VNRHIKLLAAFLVAGTLTACQSTSIAAGTVPEASEVETFSDLFTEGYSADYEPIATTSDLAEVAYGVVSGTAAEVVPGREFAKSPEDPALARTIVVRIENAQVLQGPSDMLHKGSLYLELPAPYNENASAFNRLLPKNAPVIVYVEPALTSAQTQILDEAAGRPKSAFLAQLVSPQGFFMATTHGAAQIMVGLEVEAHLEDFGPEDETALPQE